MGELRGKKILIVDDNAEMLQLIERVFAREDVRTYTAQEGQEALRQFFAVRPDLVILDVMMPDMDGWTVCRQIRNFSDVPIVVLTVLDREQDVIRSLDCGADCYVTKPFSPGVLKARVRAALRRTPQPDHGEVAAYRDDYLTIDLDQGRVFVHGKPVRLSATEYRLLAFLLENASRVLTFRQILQFVWNGSELNEVENVHTCIWRLRKKLEQDPGHPRYLLTEHSVGYFFQMQAI